MSPAPPRKRVVRKPKKAVRKSVSSVSTDRARAAAIDNIVEQVTNPVSSEDVDYDEIEESDDPEYDPESVSESTEVAIKQGAVVRKSKKNNKYDWPRIREIYVEGHEDAEGKTTYPTLKEMSDRYGIPETRLREHSAAERWREARAVHQNKMDHARQAKRAKELAREAVDFDSSTLRASKLGIQLITQRMGRIARDAVTWEANRAQLDAQLAAGMSIRPQDLRGPIYFEEIRALAQALQVLQSVGRTSLGEDVERGVSMPEPGEAPVVNLHIEMTRDDPERTARLLQAAAQAGLLGDHFTGSENEWFEGEVVDDDQPDQLDDGTPTEGNDGDGTEPTAEEEVEETGT